MPGMKAIRLRPGKERSLLHRHPWVFQGSIERGGADAGETVRVEAADGRFLAWGAFSPNSMIRVRAWSFEEAERIDAAFFARRIERAVALRARLQLPSNGVRLVHGEADRAVLFPVGCTPRSRPAKCLNRWRRKVALARCGPTARRGMCCASQAAVASRPSCRS